MYRELYYKLFAAIADAVGALERGDAEEARDLLVSAMREAEERVISAGEEE